MALEKVMNGFRLFALLGAIAIFLSGCAGGGSGTGSTAPDPDVLFFNGVHDSGAYDFLIDDDVLAAALSFVGISPNFFQARPIIQDVTVRESATTNVIWAETYEFLRDRNYVISALGIQAYGVEPLKRARLFRHEVNRELPNGTKSRIYLINGFNRKAGFLTTAIDFQNPGNNPQVALRDVPFGGSEGTLIDATTHTFEVRRTATETVYVTRTFTFGGGKIYAVFVLGVEEGVGNAAPRIEIIELTAE